MNIDLTRQRFFTNILYVILLSLLFWSSWIFSTEIPTAISFESIHTGTSLGDFIDLWLINHPVFGVAMSAVLVIVNSLTVVRIGIRNTIFIERSYIPALIYVIVGAGFFNSFLNFRPLLVSSMILLAVDSILRSSSKSPLSTDSYLKIGVYLGFAATIYAPAISLLPIIFVALLLFRNFRINEWISAIIGYVIPLFLLGYINWLRGIPIKQTLFDFRDALFTKSSLHPLGQQFNFAEWGFIGIIVALLLLSVLVFIKYRKAFNLKSKKTHILFFWIFLISIMTMILAPCGSLEMLPIIATSLSIIITLYFSTTKPSFLSNLTYLLLIIVVVVIHVLPMIR